MTVEQSLAGAMGCASWRAHYQVREYAELAPAGLIIRGGRRSSPTIGQPASLGLNEVGVTDAVMATLWRAGPQAASLAVSSAAEANHVGADIAIVHSATARILLYQAKLARLDGTDFKLKYRLTTTQARFLKRRHVELQGTRYRMTGRLALYQADFLPFIGRCSKGWPFSISPVALLDWPYSGLLVPEPAIGRYYYERVLVVSGCSPSGVLSAPVFDRQSVSIVPSPVTWPWEFDVYEWLERTSPLDHLADASDTFAIDRGGQIPDFEEYRPTTGEPGAEISVEETARQLAEQLRLPVGHRLYVIAI